MLFIFLTKTENQILKKSKTEKPKFLAQKPKIPMPPSLASLAFVHGGTTQHSSAQPWKRFMEFWGEKKNFQMSVHSIVSRRRDIMAVT